MDNKYDGFSDILACIKYKQLDETYENSKFIYTVRPDLDSWSKSLFDMMVRKGNRLSIDRRDNRENIYGVVFPKSHKELQDAYIKHHINIDEYFKNRHDDLLKINLFGDSTPQELYDFVGRQGDETFYPNLGDGSDGEVNKLIQL